MTHKKPVLIIICGLPAAGKTTLAKKLAHETPAVRFCPDDWMQELGITLWDEAFREKLEQRFWELGQELLKLGQSVVLEYGFWSKSERDKILHKTRTLGVKIELHYLDVPVHVLKTRLHRRGMEGDNILADKIEGIASTFEPPDQTELRMYDNFRTST